MSTLYEMFKVSENATQEEIKNAYDNIIKKSETLPQNEKIVEKIRRVKIAYGILSNPEKRKKYDEDLATKRANELLESVQIKEEPKPQVQEENVHYKSEPIDREKLKQAIDEQVENIVSNASIKENDIEKINKSAEKEQQKQIRKEKRQAKKEEQLKREREMYEYGSYLEKQGYKVKYPWTWLRVKRLLISIIAVIITFVILWHIPFVHNMLMDLYENNIVIKYLVDAVLSIINGIISSIKG